ncbi:MAG TPA: PA2778 family cysteine peptidase [Gallionella sp.]|nr:PA2778 family cysteine peptidase [Gallionella sp.]
MKVLSRNARLLAGVLLLFLGGCASTPQTNMMLAAPHPSLPRHVELTEVPYFVQDSYQCGPASLAMALNAASIKVTPDALKPEVYLPDRHGSLQVEMLGATRRHGAIAYQLAPELNDVLTEVASGTPVVVLQNLALSWYPIWHYAVVIGYDLDSADMILRSGPERRQILPMRTFENTWARSNYWAMVTLQPGIIPKTADATSYVSAVTALEKVSSPAAMQSSYSAALKRWPDNLAAQIGVGNTAYRMYHLPQAEAAYRRATQDHPDSAAAFNNLAQTLADQGRYKEALIAAHQAVDIGGSLSQAAQETLTEIESKMRQ